MNVYIYRLCKFHYYLCGIQLIVISDYGPLEIILHKPLIHAAVPRIQRMKMRILRYDYNKSAIDVLGTKLVLPATLSLSTEHNVEKLHQDYIHFYEIDHTDLDLINF